MNFTNAMIHRYDNEYAVDHPEPDDVTCRHCGPPGLFWTHTGVRWSLADRRGIHHCTAAAEEFPCS